MNNHLVKFRLALLVSWSTTTLAELWLDRRQGAGRLLEVKNGLWERTTDLPAFSRPTRFSVEPWMSRVEMASRFCGTRRRMTLCAAVISK